MKVLIVPEANAIAKKVGEYLNEHHVNVTTAKDEQQAVSIAAEDPQCAIVAVETGAEPAVDAAHLSQDLRQNGTEAPILVVSDKSTPDRSISVLDSGADDIVGDSTALPEVNARIRAMTRRCNAVEGTPRQVGDLKIDVNNRVVTFTGTEILFTPREFEILELLSRRPGKTVGREMIFDAIWPNRGELKSNSLEVITSRIRKKLNSVGAGDYVQTLKGSGYRLVVPQARPAKEPVGVPESTPQGVDDAMD